jgi:hypothetical protein
MTQVKLSLPDELARQAQQAGLLQPEAIASLLREAVRERQVSRLFATMDQLHKLEPRLSEEEIQAELEAARAERRAQRAACR